MGFERMPSQEWFSLISEIFYFSQVLTSHIKAMITKLMIRLCRLLITFANSLNPDQAQRIVGSDLDSNCLAL